jgi:Hg(II)-responsive transcriptional regulator
VRIGDLARGAGVGVETVRFYQRRGLLSTPPKPSRGTRSYSAGDVARIRFIRRAQQLGFSLDEIAALLKLSRTDCADVRALAQGKLALVHEKIADLTRLAAVLDEVIARCARRRPYDGCPIIDTLADASDKRA